MSLWMINLFGLLLITGIIWWFWLSKPKAYRSTGEALEIMVEDGVYTPARIEVPVGKSVTLRFIRKDATPCAQTVIFDDFNISQHLAINKPTDITLKPEKSGDYVFACEMQMYKGILSVKDDVL
jgi:plastocyanin domain-containing protein